jgi:hypothetical protein
MKKLMITATMVLLSAMNMMAQDKLTVSDFSIKAGETVVVDINVDNSTTYTAFQFDWTLPDKMSVHKTWDPDEEEYVWAVETPLFKNDHALTIGNPSGNLWRFLAYSNSSKVFKTGTTILKVTLKAEADITVGDATSIINAINFTKPDGTKADFADVNIKVTVTSASGINEITIDNPADVYDLQGNKVRSNATSTDGLSKGVYIINGQKVIVK